ncbi:abscisic acid-deficient protein Aba4 family protein [Chamaesiphon sp. OTE_20_metabat_361]|uniref:abscisic acid-deficient protein Aba4 family protein n=1 Tax=Chamaesiphon sp. OTE_20_metabat_361 TaxID=2964689 RepID=UPI00286CF576|nr:abscisic acid-deficient protein Aba4 family protein [Chamaesiphon sp. OTE_20_metabat_361]
MSRLPPVGYANDPDSAALANPKLPEIARFIANEGAAALGWVHFLVMGLFVGRYIYLEGQNKGIVIFLSVGWVEARNPTIPVFD